jgi:hypothetical protein
MSSAGLSSQENEIPAKGEAMRSTLTPLASPISEASKIHRYPLRPEGFEEPLFQTRASKVEIMEHFLQSDWLCRASELAAGEDRFGGCSERPPGAPVRLRNRLGRIEELHRIGRGPCRRRFSWKRARIVEVIERSREVYRWWEESAFVDRYVFKVLLSNGAVVDLVLEGSGEWFLLGGRG